MNKYLAIIFFLLLPALTGRAQKNEQVKIDSLLQKAFRSGLFNGNVLVVNGNKEVYKGAIGYADATKTTKLTTEHRFHIGSIAKEFNAVGMMLLTEQGKVKLSDKVSSFLPQLPAWAASIQVRDLLGYTSGLPDVQWATVDSDEKNMNNLLQLKQLDFEPGTRYAYNNNNVFLQRRIIESVTGMSFKDFVQQKLLAPAGMNHSVMDPVDSDTLVARAFDNAGKQDPLFVPISGWLAVTLDDFYKWEQQVVQYKIISPASTRFLLLPYSPSRQSGLGFDGRMEGDRIIRMMHDGTARNYQALLVCSPQQGRTVILMCNNKQNNLDAINEAIQQILDGKPYRQPKKPAAALFQPAIDSVKGPQILSLYNKLKAANKEQYAFDSEATLNELGYYLLQKKRAADAVVVFKHNTKLFPTSGNVFDSLGEAYYTKGDKKNALISYRKSLKLDPGNDNAKKIIAELEKEANSNK